MTPGAVADALVLHGATLNVRVRLPRSGAVESAQLLMDGRAAELHRRDGRLTGALRLPTADAPSRHRLVLRVVTSDGRTRERPVRAPFTSASARCPVTGVRFTLGAAPFGGLRISSKPSEPCAQVTGVVTGWTGVTVSGRLIGLADPCGARVELSSEGARRRLPVSVLGGRFRLTVPAEVLGEGSWRLTLVTDVGPRLPIGRHVDDPAVRYPARLVAVGPGRLVRIQPHYSERGRLLLSCSDHEETA
ncbi:hypothetical protein ACIBG8_02790 [Nonomuraea sp. NPDC050556]|uniref:hypothetical protein n=1 Tax=Nonomuraea sp. NPDC050556 TaxID=3364369 RepID=UPI0037B1D058